MGDYTESISLADTKVGNRWIGISTVGPVTVNGATPSNALTRVRMVFRLGQSGFVLDSQNAEITITDADTWEAEVPARDDFLPMAGSWEWSMQFWQSGLDSPWTLYKGTIRVHDDVD